VQQRLVPQRVDPQQQAAVGEARRGRTRRRQAHRGLAHPGQPGHGNQRGAVQHAPDRGGLGGTAHEASQVERVSRPRRLGWHRPGGALT
jgi:hypothetical protein